MLASSLTPPGQLPTCCYCTGHWGRWGCLALPVSAWHSNREESNHLSTASSSSTGLCLEIELRRREKPTSIIKGFSGGRHSAINYVRATSSSLTLPRFTCNRRTRALFAKQSCKFCFLLFLVCPPLPLKINQAFFFLLLLLPQPPLTFLSTIPFPPSFPAVALPLVSVPGFQFRSTHTFCLRLITSLMAFRY